MNIKEIQHIIDLLSFMIEETNWIQTEISKVYNKIHNIQSDIDQTIQELSNNKTEDLRYEVLLDRCNSIIHQMTVIKNHLIKSQGSTEEYVRPSAEQLYELACEYEGEPVQSMQAALDKYGCMPIQLEPTES